MPAEIVRGMKVIQNALLLMPLQSNDTQASPLALIYGTEETKTFFFPFLLFCFAVGVCLSGTTMFSVWLRQPNRI